MTGHEQDTVPSVEIDQICAQAVDLARAAAAAVGGADVGDHQEISGLDSLTVNHSFTNTNKAYRGWRWVVTLTRIADSLTPTVCEVTQAPGPDAITAPAWVPWSDRVRASDVKAGDVIATAADDERLVPSYVLPDDELRIDRPYEMGLGRIRVMSHYGRAEAAKRWHNSDQGPASELALLASDECATCGFYLPLAGSLGSLFGGCGNKFSPNDGQIVSADHGCGAHSQTLVEHQSIMTIDPQSQSIDAVAEENADHIGNNI